MSNLVEKIMCGIIATAGLGAAAEGNGSSLRESCRKLANVAAYEWADIEQAVHISCLGAGVIPRVHYERMVNGFSDDCADRLDRRRQMEPRSGRGEVRIHGDELTLMFIRHYDPLFKEFCSDRNPGKGLRTDPAQYPEA